MKIELKENVLKMKVGDFTILKDVGEPKLCILAQVSKQFVFICLETGDYWDDGFSSISSLLSVYEDNIVRVIPSEKMLLKEID